LTLAVFLPAGEYDFVWDDGDNILENPYFRPPTFANALRFWERPFEKLYIPLTYTVWAGLAGMAQIPADRADEIEFSPRPFHLANVVFHILGALVVFAILKRLVRHDWAAFGGALFFVWHPAQVEAVTWVTGLKDVLSGFLSLVAIWLYLQHKRPHYVLATLAFILALLAKPGAVAVPVVVWVLDYWVLRRPMWQGTLAAGPWLVLASPIMVVNKLVQPDSLIGFVTPLWARPLVAGDALAFYLYKLVWPLWLGPDYGRSPQWLLQQGWAYVTWVVPLGLLIFIWARRNREPWLAASAGVFVAGILPVSGLVPFVFQSLSTVADRYLYLSLLGAALALARFLAGNHHRVVVALCIGALALLGLRSALQIRHWQDETTLYPHALSINPNSSLAHYNLGNALTERGLVAEAIAQYRESARITPNYPDARNNLGVALARLGKFDEAVEQYHKAVQADPTHAKAYYNLGNALVGQGRPEKAIEQYRQALRIDPNYAMAHNNLAITLVRGGDLESGVKHLRRALELNPTLSMAHRNLGEALANQGKTDEAIEHYRQALRWEPEFAGAHEELARLLAREGRREEAIRHMQEALRIMKAGPAKP
jgi:tetratricopeptide (TPR) repeat protein